MCGSLPGPMMPLTICRAELKDVDEAFAITTEYYDAVGVLEREDIETFARIYFGIKAGFWLARRGSAVVGCVGLKPLKSPPNSGEVKRLYVQPASRGQGIADELVDALHFYARAVGWQSLYLDSKDDLRAAHRFYERRGYKRCPRYNDNRQATIFMVYDLR
jgi:N-acetylglutamate synthase-like GNAT family acetyltransferase